MSKNDYSAKNTKNAKTSLFTRLIENNKAVFVLSLLIAFMCWVGVSMFQSTQTEKTFSNIKIQLNLEDSTPDKNGLKLYGDSDYFVDVTVKGKSYLLNAASFADKISVAASLASVSAAGTYTLPLSSSIDGVSITDAEITYMSKSSVSLYFDEPITKEFELNIELNDKAEGYSLPDGYVRENPRLSVDTVKISGPAMEISKIVSVNAVAELNKELTGTEAFEAKIVPVGSNAEIKFPNVVIENEEAIYITVPVSCISEYTPVLTFTGMPKSYKESGVKYTISPTKVKINISSSETELIKSSEISVGTVDFSQLNNEKNYIKLSADDLSYSFADGVTEFVAVIDMSSMDKRWLEVPVSTDGVKLPEGATLVDKSIQSVQVVGPSESVIPIDASEVLAVPVLDGVKLVKGINEVPVKITLRTLTDSWVRGEYTVKINLE